MNALLAARPDTQIRVDRVEFITAMGAAVNAVNVVTTDGPAGRYGLTVSATSSVSADPPLVLVCINRRSPVRDALCGNGVFCLNLLSTEQRHVSETFSGHPRQGRAFDFECADWDPGVTGAPVLLGAVSSFDCILEHAYDAGSHTIFVGAVKTVRSSGDQPLLYSRRAYGRLVPLGEQDRYKYCT